MIDKPQGVISGRFQKVLDGANSFFHHLGDQINAGLKKPSGKVIALLVIALLISLCIFVSNITRTVTVQINIACSTTTRTYETREKHVIEFFEASGINFDASEDLINCPKKTRIRNDMVIVIDKPFDVTVTADGEKHSLRWVAPFTVQDVLDNFEITLGKNDRINKPLDSQPGQNEKIIVQRVRLVKKSKIIELDFDVEKVKDSSMYAGSSRITQRGVKGKAKRTTTITYVDGKKESKKYKDKVLVKPRKQIVHVGTKPRPYSTGESGTLDVAGKPTEYVDKFTGCKITAYTDRVGARGAYGTTVHRGTCAVDPRVIPYGSLLYVSGYGYAVANDCGGAIKGTTIDIFLDSESQCRSWGVRHKTVYVIRYGP